MGNAEYMGSAVQSSPLTSTLTMRAFLTVFLAVAVCGEADPYTIGQVLAGRTAGGVITGVSYPGVGTVAGFPYTAVHAPVVGYSHPVVYGKREAEAEPEPYTVGQVLTARLMEVPSPMLTTDTVCPRLLDSPTLLRMLSPQLSTTVYIPSTARGRLRPSPSTVTPPELSLTCTTLLLWLPLVSDTLSP